LIFVLLERPLWAGLFAGLAGWTKDEGILFCVVLLIGLAALRRRDLGRYALGLAPAAAVVVVFKIFMAPHVNSQFGGGMAARLLEPGRYGLLIGSLKDNLLGLGADWYHPVLPLIAYGLGVRMRVNGQEDRRLSLWVTAGLLGGYCVVLLGTKNDFRWQLDTACGRLLVQWWPLAVATAMVWFGRAEVAVAEAKTRKAQVSFGELFRRCIFGAGTIAGAARMSAPATRAT